ncbi:hypothetical protein OY671_003630 [Metschnikowia pulcherrima]|nr:hypothetical protein OY671_003630 [Metschnikowia pulcherrima]
MTELSAEEKRRLLRERRQAKMSQGKATERLNTILTQGSSVNTALVKSVLETTGSAPSSGVSESAPSTAPVANLNTENLANLSQISHEKQVHDDPEVPDISSLLQTGRKGSVGEEPDMEALMQKLFAGAGGNTAEGKLGADDTANFFTEMMKTMAQDPNAIPETPENASYQTKLNVYNEYQQKSWKARFLVIRIFVHTINFIYHYLNCAGFAASSNAFIRDISPAQGAGSFMTIFVSAEIAIVSSYFLILSSNGVLSQSSRNHPASKLLSLASAVFPQATAYQSLLDSALVYWGGASIIIGDLMLVVVLFGLASVLC